MQRPGSIRSVALQGSLRGAGAVTLHCLGALQERCRGVSLRGAGLGDEVPSCEGQTRNNIY